MMCEDLRNWCEEHAAEQLELLKTLAAIPAPSHHEELRAAFIQSWLRDCGAENVYIDEAKNVVLPFGCDGKSEICVYMAHIDVVFPDMEPLPVREENGRLYAPGVGDDTANVTALMMCAKYLLSNGMMPKEPVLLVFNSCEEGLGNLKGVRQIVSDYRDRIAELVSFDGQYSAMVVRAVGSERWKVSASTCGGHSYGAFGNPNAIAHLSGLIGKLYQQPVPQRPDRKTTYNVGTIQGGTSVNTIAQYAEMTYEYRSDDPDCLQQMRDQFLKLVEDSRCPEADFQITLLGERPCGNCVPQVEHEKLLQRCRRVITDVTGIEPRYRASSTDANIPLSLGIPATTFGLYVGAGSHTREEYIEIDSLRTGLKIGLQLLAASFC
jgi:acetylornithine deacetylase/succinyl-diaminopimelate desuccinylase-like protein